MNNEKRANGYLKGNPMGKLTPAQVKRLKKKGRKEKKRAEGTYHSGRNYL